MKLGLLETHDMSDIKQQLELKRQVYETLLLQKQEQFQKIKNHQRGQLKSINEADLDRSEHLESMTENMMQEMRVESGSLDHLEDEINYIKENRSLASNDKVGKGTLVKTSYGNFLVAVAQEEFEVGNETFTGISDKSPIYKALEGKKANDELEFNGKNIKITEVI